MALVPKPQTTNSSSPVVMADAQYRFIPLWDTKTNDVFGYTCEARWLDGQTVLTEADLRADFSDPHHLYALDIESLLKATGQANAAASQFAIFKVIIPVHFSTLFNKTLAEDYLSLCNEQVWQVYDSICFEIVEPPVDILTEDLITTVASLEPFGQGLFLRVDVNFENFKLIPEGKFISIGFDLLKFQRSEEEFRSDIHSFQSKAKESRILSYVLGLNSTSLSIAALTSKYNFVGGEIIAPPLDSWDAINDSIDPANLLKSIMKSQNTRVKMD